MIALHLYATEMANNHVILYTDNQAVSDILNAKTTRQPQILQILRLIVLHTLKFNIVITSRHISGKSNVLPDALSRNIHTPLMLQEYQMDPVPTPIPVELLPDNFAW